MILASSARKTASGEPGRLGSSIERQFFGFRRSIGPITTHRVKYAG
jgi:hypothetical protein